MSLESDRFFEFGPFRMDVLKRVLLKDENVVQLTPKTFDLLLALVRRQGKLVEKSELLQELWPDTFVEEANLSVTMSALRKALGERANEHLYIVTIPGRGYRFVAELTAVSDDREAVDDQRFGAGVNGELRPEPLREAGLAAHSSARRPTVSRGAKFSYLVIMLLLAAGASALYLWPGAGHGVRPAAKKSIAILPFKVLGTDAADDYLGLALTDVLIARLSGVGQITIRPTSAVRRYQGLDGDPVSIGRELNVESIVEGTVQKTDNRIRLTVRLVGSRGGQLLWASTFDETLGDLFALEDSISEQVASALTLEITPEERERLKKRQTNDPEAYRDYLKGRYFAEKRTAEGLQKGVASFRRAIERDPTYASAYAGLADCYAILGVFEEIPPKQVFPLAQDAAGRALAIDKNLAEAHALLAFARQHYDWDWSGAEKEYRRAIELRPGSAQTHHWYALFLDAAGRPDEALKEIRKALELDPLSLVINADCALIDYHSRAYEEAVRECNKTIDLDASFPRAHWYLGLAYQQMGMLEEARREYRKAIDLSNRSAVMLGWMGYACALSGRRDESAGILRELNDRARQKYITPYAMALIHIGLGERDLAFEWLEKAYEDRSDVLVWLKREPGLDSLRPDPRFAALEHRVAFEPRFDSTGLRQFGH